MNVLQPLILAVLGLLGGVLSGVAGVGGGIVFVPALVYAAGWNIKEAVAASLVIVIFSSFSGTLRSVRGEDPVDWRAAAILSASVAPASLIGVYVSIIAPASVVQMVFALILLLLAYPMARGRKNPSPDKELPVPLVLLAGVGIGALSGLVGIGGGVVLVPLLILGFNLSTKQSVSTSLAIILTTGIVASVGYIATGFGDLFSLPPLVLGATIGAWFGVRLREWLPEKTIRYGFAGFMVVVSLRTLGDATGIL